VSVVSPRIGVILFFALVSGSVSSCGDASVGENRASELPTRGSEAAWQPSDTRSLFDFVTSLAAERSRTAYVAPPSYVKDTPAAALSYDQYRAIRFRADRAIWGDDLPFEVQFDHPGGGVETPVRVHLVSADTAREVGFDTSLFTYDGDVAAQDLRLPPEAGFAGFRILNPMNRSDHFDEVVSFRGASYFRLLGPDHVYGLSARGIALGVAGPEPEEFPDFVEFWIHEPLPGDTSVVVHALLDGPSVAGAYRFELVPGRSGETAGPTRAMRPTEMHVGARLFARAPISDLGVAPLTSMYLHGTFDLGGESDVRPRVHDSEGLIMETHAGEVIWRPLSNPGRVRLTSLYDRDPAGFGLAQPTRDFERYLDLEALYHRRPGLWVDPAAAWGAGSVRLAELPSESEFADNMVTFWAPEDALDTGDRSDWAYTLRTFDVRPPEVAGPARVVRTRVARAGLPGQMEAPPAHHRRILVDFVGGGLDDLATDAAVEALVTSSTGRVTDVRAEALPDGGYRATWILEGEPGVPADMRAYLRSDRILTETWSWLLDVPGPEEP